MGITQPAKELARSQEPSRRAVVQGRAAAPLAVGVHRGTAEPVHKSLYEKQGGLLAVDFPRCFGDAKHGRVTKTFSDPIASSSSSYNSLFFPFLTAFLHLSPGTQPWEAKIKPLSLFTRCLSLLLRLQTCPGAWGRAVIYRAEVHLTVMVTNGTANSCQVGTFFSSFCQM